MFLPSRLGRRTHVIIFRLSLQGVCCVQVRRRSSTDSGFFMLSVRSRMPSFVVSIGILQSCECTRQYLAVAIGRATTGLGNRHATDHVHGSPARPTAQFRPTETPAIATKLACGLGQATPFVRSISDCMCVRSERPITKSAVGNAHRERAE